MRFFGPHGLFVLTRCSSGGRGFSASTARPGQPWSVAEVGSGALETDDRSKEDRRDMTGLPTKQWGGREEGKA